MAYEFERDEYRSALRAMSDAELAANAGAGRAALGIVGDAGDDIEHQDDLDGEAE